MWSFWDHTRNTLYVVPVNIDMSSPARLRDEQFKTSFQTWMDSRPYYGLKVFRPVLFPTYFQLHISPQILILFLLVLKVPKYFGTRYYFNRNRKVLESQEKTFTVRFSKLFFQVHFKKYFHQVQWLHPKLCVHIQTELKF